MATFGVLFSYLQKCMIQQACKRVTSSLWPRLTFLELNITDILKSSGWGLEKSELPCEHNFL